MYLRVFWQTSPMLYVSCWLVRLILQLNRLLRYFYLSIHCLQKLLSNTSVQLGGMCDVCNLLRIRFFNDNRKDITCSRWDEFVWSLVIGVVSGRFLANVKENVYNECCHSLEWHACWRVSCRTCKCDLYLRQVNVVNGWDDVFTQILSVVLCVCVCTAAWRHNSTDVITSPADCVVCDVTTSNVLLRL